MNDNTLKSGSLLQGGKYKITGVLGQGGFGITYEAEQVSLGRKVAIKEFFMKDSCERDESTSHVTVPTASNRELVSKFRDKFLREARMIAALDHDHIVKIFDVFEENGTAYYVMEHLGGGSLDRQIKDKGAMPEDEAVGFIRQIADALSYLHSQNILHFDVKPSNVLLGKNGSAKLIDFGISKHYDEAGHQTSSTPVGISKGYAPLEQYQQGSDIKSFTPATDIYALGATLYALLSGSNPPEASIVNEDGVPAIDGISSSVMHAIEKAMQPRRKDRPQGVQEFLDLLDGTAKEDDDEQTVVPTPAVKVQKPEKAGTPAQKSVKPQKSEEKKSKGFPKWLYGLIAGVAVAVLAVVLMNRPDSHSAT
ncbi:MAG: serine/threonine protein kinase, partial [Bacteroidales bacterium]|nr:serine/threonine protein kinase [Candidatus Hennigimonas equi]